MNKQTTSIKSTVTAASVGGFLEMYDFVIYAFFASVLAPLFFPSTDHVASLLAVFGVFAVGYLARPIGGIIYGYFGDRLGRRKTLIYSLLFMAIPTFLMSVLPTYEQVGRWAPVLLIMLRLAQGLAVGGDFPGAITFVSEHVKKNRRGLHNSWIYFGINFGLMFGSAVASLITHNLTHQQLFSWGWRIPFALGILLALVGMYIRHRSTETPLFALAQQHMSENHNPIKSAIQTNKKNIIQGVFISLLGAVIISQIFIFMPTYLSKFGEYTLDRALMINTLSILAFTLCLPLAGLISDFIGRKKIIATGCILFMLISIPAYYFMSHNSNTTSLIAVFALAIISAMIIGPLPSTLAELFATENRYTSVAISYNVAFAIFGGLTPFILTWLIHAAEKPMIPAFYIAVCALITLMTVLTISETKGSGLNL